ncbi:MULTISPECIES: WbqC family protein [Sphingobacterium]|uniref:WbqC family protein n=1 Tax=Sphingobacterium TaxID=28453 RepID=UPI001BE437DA|nr:MULTISPECIES: WbqC family protein [Sphingobacterium]MBV2225683.1 WbqC family protein [Sphingobacterium mizutaii]
MLRKKIGIMQPYFFPYLGYISLIKHTDRFILLDTVQFIRRGWIERNRILKQKEGWLYIQVPLKKENGRSTLIKDCVLDNTKPWKEKILAQFQIYKKIAPNYELVMDFLRKTFSKDFDNITSLNRHVLTEICKYLDMERDISIFSEMGIKIDQPQDSDEWALNICKRLGAKLTYINPIGGMSFFDRTKYFNADIDMYFHQINLQEYKQGYREFEPGLSILDALMFNTKEEIHNMLDQFELI